MVTFLSIVCQKYFQSKEGNQIKTKITSQTPDYLRVTEPSHTTKLFKSLLRTFFCLIK